MRNRDLFLNYGAWGIALVLMLGISILIVSCGGGEQHEAVRASTRPSPTNHARATHAPRVEVGPAVAVQTPVPAVAPRESREVTYAEAEAAYQERRYEEATGLFTRYTEQKPDNPWGFYMLGLSAWKSGALDRAVEAFDRALELDPNHVKSRINLGRVHLDAGCPEEALASVDAALAIDPGSAQAHRVRARSFHRLGRVDEAIEAYRRAIRLDDGDAWSMNNLGLILIEAGRYDDALRPLSRAVELREEIALFRNNLGMALENTGHYDQATEAYQAAVVLDESYGKARANYQRVEGIPGPPGVEPIDLAAIARSFADEIEGWPALAAVPEDAPIPTGMRTPVVAGSDSSLTPTGR